MWVPGAGEELFWARAGRGGIVGGALIVSASGARVGRCGVGVGETRIRNWTGDYK